jgi:hypothetical protein
MKRAIQISAIVFLGVFVLLSMGNPVNAVTYSSGFQVQNLSSTEVANLIIKYIDQSGGIVSTFTTNASDPDPKNQPVPASGSRTYFPIHAGTGFNGSVIIESTTQVVAIVNTVGDGGAYFASTTGFSSGSPSINLPLLMKGNSGFDTWFNVQNVGSASTDVTVTYSNATTEGPITILPGAAKSFFQETNANLPAGFVGSATVTSTGGVQIVASVMQVGTGATKAMLGYNSFSSGSQTIQAPLVMANNSGFFSGIQVMNVGTADTNVTITYSPNTAIGSSGETPTPDTCTVTTTGVTQSCTKLQLGGQWTGTYVGGATIITNPPQNVVAIVNQLSLVGQGTAYEGFNPGSAPTTVVAPLVMANNSGFFTGIQVQNVGTGNCDNIAVAYGPNTAGAFVPTNENFPNLTQGSSNTFLQTGASWPAIYVGSATITGTGATCKVAAIVNELSFGAGDQFMTYQALAAN